MLPYINISIAEKYSELEKQENELIGKLFRELVSFEGREENEKTLKAANYIINNYYATFETIGSNAKVLDIFISRLTISGLYNIHTFRRTI